MPDVTTEPQRLALDEMSRQLVDKLNAMVHEQNERAEQFAATQHSLSALPTNPDVPAVPTLELPELAIPELARTSATAHHPAALPKKQKKHVSVPPRPTQRFEATEPSALPPPLPKPWGKVMPRKPKAGKKEEEGIGSGAIITIIVIVLILMRACS